MRNTTTGGANVAAQTEKGTASVRNVDATQASVSATSKDGAAIVSNITRANAVQAVGTTTARVENVQDMQQRAPTHDADGKVLSDGKASVLAQAADASASGIANAANVFAGMYLYMYVCMYVIDFVCYLFIYSFVVVYV